MFAPVHYCSGVATHSSHYLLSSWCNLFILPCLTLTASLKDITSHLRRINSTSTGVQDSNEKLVITLDFGTTFSGIAFFFLNQHDATIASILDWPGAEGQSVPKIPTLVQYDPKTNGFASGASVNRMENTIMGVKLLLDPQQERPA